MGGAHPSDHYPDSTSYPRKRVSNKSLINLHIRGHWIPASAELTLNIDSNGIEYCIVQLEHKVHTYVAAIIAIGNIFLFNIIFNHYFSIKISQAKHKANMVGKSVLRIKGCL